jgi:site-specific recombinase XerD
MWQYRISSSDNEPMPRTTHLDLETATRPTPVHRPSTAAKLRCIFGSHGDFPIQVVRGDGLPEVPLTVFANDLRRSLAAGSVRGYLRELLVFANWTLGDSVAAVNQWRLYGDPREVRNLLREYLTVVGECRVTQRPDTLGLRVSYVNITQQTKINVRLLLASLKKLYEVLIDRELYCFANPLIHEDAAQALAEFRRGEREAVRAATGRVRMPAISGVDEPPADLRLSQNYFRLVNREWQPKSIDDPNFPSRVYAAGQEFGWSLRELCAVRTLFESGARISEVFDLTAADWSTSHFMNRFLARNKGSHGCRVKTLMVSNPTAKLYRRYFDDDTAGRCALDPGRLTVARLSSMLRSTTAQLHEIRIYLTARGSPMNAKLFRDHYWKPALKRAGIDADPHLCRHWFVTNALRHIETVAKTEAELCRHKEELIQYMAWRSGERTLKAYEHVQRGASFARRLHKIHETMHRRERRPDQHTIAPRLPEPVESKILDQDLAYLLGEDDDD